MKKLHHLLYVMAAIACVASCEKAVELPQGSNPILPLAVDNSWTYTDTVIATTSLPSIDTIVSEITFRITRTTFVDILENVGGKRNLKRIPGFFLENDMPGAYSTGFFPIGDTIWTDSWVSFPPNVPSDCPGIRMVLDTMPQLKWTHTTSLMPAITFPATVGSSIPVAPVFHARTRCETDEFGYVGQNPLSYQLNFHPLQYEAGQVTVTTPAGTFACMDFGSELWMEGIGLIQSEQDGATAFVSDGGTLVTGSVHWKRSLKAYHLE